MSFHSFITAPFKDDRGKRILNAPHQYSSWDYLKDTRPEAEKRVFPIGTSDGRASKFKVGFYRRPAEKIGQSRERESYEEAKEAHAQLNAAARAETLAQWNARNGDALRAPASEEKIFPARRRFPDVSERVEKQNHARQKVGASRFHIELTPKEAEHRNAQIKARLESQKQSTSVLGYGRADLPTQGVSDVFNSGAFGYSERDLISKPKLKPPPADSQAAKWSAGQISLSDGSGHGMGAPRTAEPAAAGRPSGAGGSQSGSRLNTAQQSRSGASSDSTLPGRRVNRSNQTSEQLREVFSYAGVADRWANGNALRDPASAATSTNAAPAVAAPATASAPGSASAAVGSS